MDYLLYFVLLALIAEIIGTVGGFGSSLLFVPIASYFMDFQSVLGITALFHLSSNITKIYLFREGFDKKLVMNMGISAVFFVIIGAVLSKYFSPKILELALAFFLILLSLVFLLFKNLTVKPTFQNSVLGGAISGFIAGLVGTGGAIRGVVLASYNLRTSVFIATSAIIDLGIDLSRSVVYTMNGFVHYDDLYLIPILFVVSIVGSFIGKKILNSLTEAQFKNIVLSLIFLTGTITVFKSLGAI